MLEMKNKYRKNVVSKFTNILDTIGERINKCDDQLIKITQTQRTKKKIQKLRTESKSQRTISKD
jgi:hypothetical protein